MKQHEITLPELLELIERFYDCSLSDEEERQLRLTISSTTYSHPSIDEAKALMGFRRPDASTRTTAIPTRQTDRHSNRPNIRITLSIAAALALLLTLGINPCRPTSSKFRQRWKMYRIHQRKMYHRRKRCHQATHRRPARI